MVGGIYSIEGAVGFMVCVMVFEKTFPEIRMRALVRRGLDYIRLWEALVEHI